MGAVWCVVACGFGAVLYVWVLEFEVEGEGEVRREK